MGLLDMFRRRPPIADVSALEDFLDSHSAFLVQKCVFEYSRARAGVLSDKLFREPDFQAAVDVARWNGYPMALANLTEMVEGVLRPAAGGREAALLDRLVDIALTVIYRYRVPEGEPDDFWSVKSDWLRERLADIQRTPPKPVKDIPTETARQMFDLMPIQKSLRAEDFVVVRNHLRANLCRLFEDFQARLQLEPLVADLFATPRKARISAVGAK